MNQSGSDGYPLLRIPNNEEATVQLFRVSEIIIKALI